MTYQTIISTQELFANLKSKDWVVVDCRFDLTAPDWGEEEFCVLHIPGAVYANTDNDLSGPKTPLTGRHPLPEPDAFCTTMRRLGISTETQVVVYDATSGSFASRLWFLLRFYGHFKVALLDGGFAQWHKQGLPIETGWNENKPGNFVGTPDIKMITTTEEVETSIGRLNWKLIDARAPERFSGEQETIDAKAGHIPGAVNRFYGGNMDSEGFFVSAGQLKREFTDLLDGVSPENTVVYCGSGVTSCHHMVAMAIAGLPQPRLYPGSWSEWIRDPAHEIATGS
jgi:thiosulfate/3-mercaptopyruvate sulfurtransferase